MSAFPLKRDCFVTSVTLLVLRKYGEDALNWDPLTLKERVEADFRVEKLPQRIFDKLNCGLALVGTDTFTGSLEGFLSCACCMNNLVLKADEVPFVTLEQCAWAVWEYMNLDGDMTPEATPSETFSPDIAEYIRQAGWLNGVTTMPAWLKWAESPAMPDMTGDADLFAQFMQRQEAYVSDMNEYVTRRQDELTAELKGLADKGLVGGDAKQA